MPRNCKRLRNVVELQPTVAAPVEVGDGSRDPEHAVVRARAESKAVDSVVSQRGAIVERQCTA